MTKWATYEDVLKDFDRLGLVLVSPTFKRGKDTLDFICKKHPDLGIQNITYEHVKIRLKNNQCGCRECLNEEKNVLRKIKNNVNKNSSILDYTHEEYIQMVKKINPHIKVSGTYTNKSKSITIQCLKDKYKCRVSVSKLLEPYECPICKNGKENISYGVNDIESQNPVLYSMLVDKNDNQKYTINSRSKVKIKCPNCGKIALKTIDKINRRGFKCKCMTGGSLGERYLHEVLLQTGICFEEEYYINNNLSYRYDFYFIYNNKKNIIEVQGKQHTIKSFETCGGRTLEQEVENDKLKKDYALSNGIDNYIYISSKNAGFEYFKQSIIESDLSKVIDLSNVNWVRAYKNSLTSNMIRACELWNNGYKVMQISKELKIGKGTVRKYLTYGNEAEICNYDHTKSNHTIIICLNTLKIYGSQRDAERDYNLHRGCINDYLKGSRKMIIDNVEYKWMYYTDYLKL